MSRAAFRLGMQQHLHSPDGNIRTYEMSRRSKRYRGVVSLPISVGVDGVEEVSRFHPYIAHCHWQET